MAHRGLQRVQRPGPPARCPSLGSDFCCPNITLDPIVRASRSPWFLTTHPRPGHDECKGLRGTPGSGRQSATAFRGDQHGLMRRLTTLTTHLTASRLAPRPRARGLRHRDASGLNQAQTRGRPGWKGRGSRQRRRTHGHTCQQDICPRLGRRRKLVQTFGNSQRDATQAGIGCRRGRLSAGGNDGEDCKRNGDEPHIDAPTDWRLQPQGALHCGPSLCSRGWSNCRNPSKTEG